MIQASIPSPSQSLLEIGPITIHYYALCIIAGVIAAIAIGNKRFVSAGGAHGVVSDVAIIAVPAGIIGGRIYHVLTSPEIYFSSHSDWREAFYIWKGGLGIWGAISLGFVGALIAYRRHPRRNLSFAFLADALAPGLLVAQAIGRWGNWFNKELFGGPIDAPWALEIPSRYRPLGYSSTETFHPVFLYESIWCAAVAIALIYISRVRTLAPGSIFALYVAMYSMGRGFIEVIRIDDAHLILGMRLNVWTSAILFSASLLYLRRINRMGRPQVE